MRPGTSQPRRHPNANDHVGRRISNSRVAPNPKMPAAPVAHCVSGGGFLLPPFRSITMRNHAEYPFAEALQNDDEAIVAAPSGWSADRAHARIRFLTGFTGLIGVALVVALLVIGAPAHG